MIEKYAHLLVDYSLYLKEGEKLYIKSTTLAEPLIREIYKQALSRGAIVSVEMDFESKNAYDLGFGNDAQLNNVSPLYKEAMTTYDAFLFIRAPFSNEAREFDKDKEKIFREARKEFRESYYKRNGNGEMKRSLCQYPTQPSADLAKMTIEEYSEFIYTGCKLYEKNPSKSWQELSKMQDEIITKLHSCSSIRYVNEGTDIRFSTKGRTWINSDGKTNMPSGEVYTSPVEDSVNGHITFDFPSRYFGEDVENVHLKVKDGQVEEWNAEIGKHVLDRVFEMDGTRIFGEAAIGTNYSINRATNNILFDEKIGGTVHMALGQSYPQAGGKNKSSVHWDLISDMRKEGRIYGDHELIYENGKFLF